MANEKKFDNVRDWIENHFGTTNCDSKALCVATVKVLGGVAVGTGFSIDDAYKNLYKDLTQKTWPDTNQ